MKTTITYYTANGDEIDESLEGCEHDPVELSLGDEYVVIRTSEEAVYVAAGRVISIYEEKL